MSPDPSLFIASLDGTGEQGLVFGQGSLSPDGSQLVYGDENGHILVLDITAGQKVVLTKGSPDSNPHWSPDGKLIAFQRVTDKGLNLYVMDADGQNIRALTDSTNNFELSGWTADSRQLVFMDYQTLSTRLLNMDGGEMQPIAALNGTQGSLTFSPDGQWIAYIGHVPGRMQPGIFVSRLDGTDQRLLVQLDEWSASLPLWAPDGDWLAFLAGDQNKMIPDMETGLVNVKTCQVIPLLDLDGEIQECIR